MAGTGGTVYLIHFDRPYKHARHYIGWALDVRRRLTEHAAGRGAHLLAVVKAAGIGWPLPPLRCPPPGPAGRRTAPQPGRFAVAVTDHGPGEVPGRCDDSGAAGRAHGAAPRRGERQACPARRTWPGAGR